MLTITARFFARQSANWPDKGVPSNQYPVVAADINMVEAPAVLLAAGYWVLLL
jgi:hypothetical protein